jgi:hypothetical protein
LAAEQTVNKTAKADKERISFMEVLQAKERRFPTAEDRGRIIS